MLIQNQSSPSWRNGPSQAFRVHKPVLKAKQRALLPTVSSLLVGVPQCQQLSNHLIDFMEIQTKNLRIPETDDSLEVPIGIYTSGRTEDIFVREDENGVRSHYCPLDEDRDGERDENEDCPDQPMAVDCDLDWTLQGIGSEEMPYLMAEKPSESDSGDNQNSDVDTSTSMIYSPLRNQLSSVDEDCSLRLLIQQEKWRSPTLQSRLDKKTMKAWAEESSDESEYDTRNEKDLEIFKKCNVVGEESDMEEFNETLRDDKRNTHAMLESLGNQEHTENILEAVESPESKIQTKTNTSEQSDREKNSENISVDGSKHETSDVVSNNVNKLGSRDCPGDDSEADRSSQSSKRQSDSVKAENAILNLKITRNDSKDRETLRHVSSDIRKKIHEDESGGISISAEDSGKMGVDRTAGVVEVTSPDETKCGEKPGTKSTGKDNKTDSQKKSETGAIPKKPKEAKRRDILSMEPVAMNLTKSSKKEETQPDLATSLRFLTEVYHTKDEDGMFSDTLSNTDMVDEVPITEMPKTASDDCKDEKPAENLITWKSPSKSSAFEPSLPEDARTKRNKLTKFFTSFKKKLIKKV